jgi:hypothetical protein
MSRTTISTPLASVVVAFVVSRIVYYALGVRFDMNPLDSYLQYLDPLLLRENLWQSLFYLHTQPPLYNLFLGVVMQIFPGHETAAFHSIHILLGLVATLAIYRLMVRLGVSSTISATLTILFAVSPAWILYENQLFYDFPIMALLPITALFLHRFMSRTRMFDGLVFFFLMASLVLLRTMFHPLWFVIIVGVLVWIRRDRWPLIVRTAAVPFLLVLLVYLKNLFVFGGFYASSWFGPTLFVVVTNSIPIEIRQEHVARREINRISLQDYPFLPLSDYRDKFGFRYKDTVTGIPALDQGMKSTGYGNYNHLAYLQLSEIQARDGLFLLKAYPKKYAATVAKSVVVYSYPASFQWSLNESRKNIEWLDRLYNHLFFGQIIYNPAWGVDAPIGSSESRLNSLLSCGFAILLGCPLLVIYGLIRLRRDLRASSIDHARVALQAFMLLTILVISVLSLLLAVSENNRYRFSLDPFFLILVGILLEQLRPRLLPLMRRLQGYFSRS